MTLSQKKINKELLTAIKRSKILLTLDLIDRGADIETQDEENKTPLILASMKNQEATVETLIKQGANLEAADKDGNRALMFASKLGYTKIVMAIFISRF